MINLLFLDIDGVANSFQHGLLNPLRVGDTRLPENDLNHTCLGLLKLAVERTNAKVVITSTWRKEYTQIELIDIFNKAGWDIPLIGYTPNIGNGFRGEEVARFLEDYVLDHDLDNYVIVDDSADYYLDDKLSMDFRFNQPLVRTDARIGFCYRDLLGVLYYLNPEDNLIDALKQEVNFKEKVYVDAPWVKGYVK